MTKGELMELVYSEDELISIDSAIPMDRWEEFPPSEHVMNYNGGSVFGKIENLIEVGMLRGKLGVCRIPDQECKHCGGIITIN